MECAWGWIAVVSKRLEDRNHSLAVQLNGFIVITLAASSEITMEDVQNMVAAFVMIILKPSSEEIQGWYSFRQIPR